MLYLKSRKTSYNGLFEHERKMVQLWWKTIRFWHICSKNANNVLWLNVPLENKQKKHTQFHITGEEENYDKYKMEKKKCEINK